MLFAQKQDMFRFAEACFFHKSGHQLARDSLLLKFGQNSQGKDDHVLPIWVMPDQLFQRLIADVVFIRRAALEQSLYGM